MRQASMSPLSVILAFGLGMHLIERNISCRTDTDKQAWPAPK